MDERTLYEKLPFPIAQLVTSPDDIIFTSGAHVEGFANSYSDIDLFGVYRSEEVPTSRLSLLVIDDPETHGFSCVDLQSYQYDEFVAFAERLNRLAPDDYESIIQLPLGDLDLYYRTSVGWGLVNKAGFDTLVTHFRKPVAAALLAAWTGARSAAHSKRAKECLQASRREPAIMAAREAAASAVNSILARNGEAFPTLKWRFEKLKRCFGESSTLYETAWRLKAPGTMDWRDYVQAVMAFCTELGVDGSARTASADAWPRYADTARVFTVADQTYLVWNRTFVYSLNGPALRLWKLIGDCTSVSELSRRFAAEYELSNQEATRCVAAGLSRFTEAGLLESPHAIEVAHEATDGQPDSRGWPEIVKLPRIASEFFGSLFRGFTYFSRHYEVALLNIRGGLAAGQLGFVVVRTQDALEAGIMAFLAMHGEFPVSREGMVPALERVLGQSNELFQESIAMLCLNPSTPAEVEDYAKRCISLVEDRLELAQLRALGSRGSQEQYDRRTQTLRELAEIAEYLGIVGPYSSNELQQTGTAVSFFMAAPARLRAQRAEADPRSHVSSVR